MSVLIQIKGLLLAEMKATNPELKKAIVNVINAVDQDLSIQNYEQSSDVDNAMIDLDNILIHIDEKDEVDREDESEIESDIIITRNQPISGYNELDTENVD